MEILLPKNHISHFADFKKVCRIVEYQNEWFYTNVNSLILYSSHTSWVYFIVVNGIIWKIGASGVVLGIRGSDGQPLKSTKCRLGRYRSHKGTHAIDTDEYCRSALLEILKDSSNIVEFWAYQCPAIKQTIQVAGEQITVEACIHWDLEKAMLAQFKKATGSLPKLNKGNA